MFINYLRIAWRNLAKNKLYSTINLVGLAIGMGSFLLVLSFIQHERGFDRFHSNTVHRVGEIKSAKNNSSETIARTMFPMGPTLKSDFPEVVDFTRIAAFERMPLKRPGRHAIMATACMADASFFNIFNFRLISGSPATVLQKPNSIVVTTDLANRLFGSEDPIGQEILHQGRDTTFYIVTGVLENLPTQSHLSFEAVRSMDPLMVAEENENWNNDWVSTYLRLIDGTDVNQLQSRFPAYLERYMGKEKAKTFQLLLQPIHDIHLWSWSFSQDMLNNHKFNGSYLYLLAVVSILVLALAIINYTNLTGALTINRAKEIGVRKTNGAARIEVVFQFLTETMLFTSIAFVLALVLIWFAITPLNVFTGREMVFDLWQNPWLLFVGCALIVGTGMLAGIPIARSLSGIKPVQVLKGNFWQSSRSPVRNAMVVIQFTIAIALSIVAISAFRQLKFMQDYDTGFNKDEVVVAQVSWVRRNYVVTLMDELRTMPGVNDVTGALRRLGDPVDINDVIFRNENQQSFRMPATTMWVDYNYIPFYGIKLLAGRNISPAYGSDARGNSYLINETMANKLVEFTDDPKAELNTLIGKEFRFNFQDSLGTIVGIVRDFNFNSLHHKVEPLCISYQHDYYFRELSIRLERQHLAQTLPLIEAKWKELLPNQEMEYRFLDEQMEQLYKTDKQVGQMMAVLTILAILISCSGLIGLALFNTERRVKEIGIRKVLGATISGIVLLLSRNFIKLVFVAIAIATPIAKWAVDTWLNHFAYRIKTDWLTFVFAGLTAIVIALLAVIWQSIRAATANPVKSLRSE